RHGRTAASGVRDRGAAQRRIPDHGDDGRAARLVGRVRRRAELDQNRPVVDDGQRGRARRPQGRPAGRVAQGQADGQVAGWGRGGGGRGGGGGGAWGAGTVWMFGGGWKPGLPGGAV